MKKNYVTLEEVCVKGSSNIAQKDLEKNEGKYPIYGASGFIKNVDFYAQDKPYIAVVKDGAGIGRTMMLPAHSSVIGTMQYLLPKDNIDISYLYYAVTAMNLAKYYTGATIPHIYFKDYRKEKLPVVDKIEQKKIVEVLSKIDALVIYHKRQLDDFEVLLKSRFIEMFGDLKLNDKKWEVKFFKDLTLLITDGEHSTPRRTDNGIYLLSARNVLNHSLQLNDIDYIDEVEYERISKRIQPMIGDVLLSCSGSVGRCCAITKDIKFQMVRSVALLRFKAEINPVFAEYMIVSDYLQEQINSNKTASSQSNLFQGKIKMLKGVIPPLDLQNQFADFVEEVNKSKFTHCYELLLLIIKKIWYNNYV